MIFFIGGPPRVGKTLLTRKLANKLNISWLSTDDLRRGLMAITPKSNNVHTLVKAGEWDHPQEFYAKYNPQQIIKLQNAESKEVVKAINGLVQELDYRKRNFIIEGVALYPDFFDKYFLRKYHIKFICMGITKDFYKYAWKYRVEGDWLENVDKSTFQKVINLSQIFSHHYQKSANKNAIKYFDIKPASFSNEINSIMKTLIKEFQISNTSGNMMV